MATQAERIERYLSKRATPATVAEIARALKIPAASIRREVNTNGELLWWRTPWKKRCPIIGRKCRAYGDWL